MTEIRKAVLRSVRLDDDVWERVKAMECSLNQYLRGLLLENPAETQETHREAGGVSFLLGASEPFEEVLPQSGEDFREFSLERVVDRRPKNCRCLHCGGRFAGPRWTTICSGCKSSGHTNQPAECPECTAGSAI